jgi:CubicO group peptidase (beta-lactamase class C family)
VKLTTLSLLLAVVLSACAPTLTPTPMVIPAQNPITLSAELDALMQKNYQAGVFDCSVLVARNGQVIFSQGYGFADRYKKIPNTPQTKFRLGCITKQFTAMAILLLQAQGKLNVQDKLCEYIPNCPELFKQITLQHLMSMSSGAPNTTRWSFPGEQMLPKNASLYFQPGTHFLYGDVGFNLLGRVIETVSGQSYASFLKQNIFEPLQMANTGYDDLQQVDLAKGYATAQGDIALQPLNGLFAEGRLYSTVEDLYRWDQALYTDKLLPQLALRAMFTAQVPVPDGKYYGGQGWSYGYGWFIAPDKPRYVLHGGMYPGYRTEFRRYLDDDVTIILLCNQEAVALHLTAEAIAEKLFETGKQ